LTQLFLRYTMVRRGKELITITDLRYTFNEDAANYDRSRPTYHPDLFRDVIAYAGLNQDSRAVEVGIGTGQATAPILETGCRVTAVELGQDLAAYAESKFREFPHFRVVCGSFEDFTYTPGETDLIYSATAFHWIPEDVGFPKAMDMLRPGGTLALFWNRPFPSRAGDPLFRDIQSVYRKFRPGPEPVEHDGRFERRQRAVLSHGFIDLKFSLYHNTRTFNADTYVQLLNTYSDHRNMPPEIKAPFEEEIRQAVRRHGNRLSIHDTMDLYLAGKP